MNEHELRRKVFAFTYSINKSSQRLITDFHTIYDDKILYIGDTFVLTEYFGDTLYLYSEIEITNFDEINSIVAIYKIK